MSVRVFNHSGYLLARPGQAEDAVTVSRIARLLNTAGALYSTGIRLFFSLPCRWPSGGLAAPTACWPLRY
ncbi:DUF599 family protein [Undibacterium arcticum]